MKESRRRSIAKVLSWRFTATTTTTIISFVLTGSLEVAASIGVLELFSKILLQYLHERVWLKIKYGLAKPLDYTI